MSSEKEAALGLPQVGLRFPADRNSWDGKLQKLWGRWSRTGLLSQMASGNVRAYIAYFFHLG